MKKPVIKFALRDLLWLILVAALAAGWWTERRERSVQEGIAKQTFVELEATRAELQSKSTVLHDVHRGLLSRIRSP